MQRRVIVAIIAAGALAGIMGGLVVLLGPGIAAGIKDASYAPGTRVVLIEGDGPRDDMGGILFAVPGPPAGSHVWHATAGVTGLVLKDPVGDGLVEVRVEFKDGAKTGWIDRRDLAPIR